MFVFPRVNKQIDSDLLPCFQEPFSGMLTVQSLKQMDGRRKWCFHPLQGTGVRKMKWAVIVSGSQHLQLLHVELISPEKKSLLFIQNRNP